MKHLFKAPIVATLLTASVLPVSAGSFSPEPGGFEEYVQASSSLHLTLLNQVRPIKMSFSSVAVADVLKAISLATGVNIVLGSQTEATVSMNITARTAEEALQAATAASGLSYAKAGTTYIVADATDLRKALVPYSSNMVYPVPEGAATEIAGKLQEAFPLATVTPRTDSVLFIGQKTDFQTAAQYIKEAAVRYEATRPVSEAIILGFAKPTDIRDMLTQIFPDLKVTSEQGTTEKVGGVLVVTGARVDVSAAKEMAVRLDEGAGSAGAPDFYVYELKYTSAPSAVEFLKLAAPKVEAIPGPESYLPPRGDFSPLGTALRSAAGGGGGGIGGGSGGLGGNQGGGGGGITAVANDTVLEPGVRSTVVVLKGQRAEIDLAAKMLDELDVKPVQISVEVKVVELSKGFDESLGLEYDWSDLTFWELPVGTIVPPDPARTRPAGAGLFSRVPWTFNTAINAMVEKGDAKILAKPNVRVVNNDDANIFIGDTIRARLAQANGLGGQTIDVIEFPVGIILLIRPRVNADGNITMRVNPVVSTITALDADSIPQTSSREAETTVMVQNGETIVLGGLINEEMTKSIKRIPILSDIPIIGELFKTRTTSSRRTEVVVTITPRIVKEVPEDSGD